MHPPQRQVYATVGGFVVLSICIVVAIGLGISSQTASSAAATKATAGRQACAYQRAAYNKSRAFRLQVRGFMFETAHRLAEEGRIYRVSAGEQTDPEVRKGALALAASKMKSAARTFARAKKIKLSPPPTCSLR